MMTRAILLVFALGSLVGVAGAASNPPLLPQAQVSPIPPDNVGWTIAVNAGDDLQAALNLAAQMGGNGTVVLEGGATWVGNFRLPAKPDDGTWITIRGSREADIAAPGHRIDPALHAQFMPKLLTTNGSPAIYSIDDGVNNTHGWRLVGLEIAAVPNLTTTQYGLVGLGNASDQGHVGADGSRLIFERGYIHHGQTNASADNFYRGIYIDGQDIRVCDSYITDIQATGQDTQGIFTGNSRGNHLIENNYIAATGMSVMYGGGLAQDADHMPRDITVRRNTFEKLGRWFELGPQWDHVVWDVKPLFELKMAERVLIEGNRFRNSFRWPAIALDAWDQYPPYNPFAKVTSVTVQNNLIETAQLVVQIYGGNHEVARVKIYNNLGLGTDERLSVPHNANSAGSAFYVSGGFDLDDIWIEHNTIVPNRTHTFIVEHQGIPPHHHRFTLKNNILGFGDAGGAIEGLTAGWMVPFEGDVAGGQSSAAVWDTWCPERDFQRNALVNLDAVDPATQLTRNVQSNWDVGRWLCPDSYGTAGIDATSGMLDPSSPFKNAATDGTDLGVDFAQLHDALDPMPTTPADDAGMSFPPSDDPTAPPSAGCGCNAQRPSPASWMLIGLVLVRIRRRRARSETRARC
jgi:uncharacterized protein (TIGR03382 family)